jgi:predicted sulfurtransferase
MKKFWLVSFFAFLLYLSSSLFYESYQSKLSNYAINYICEEDLDFLLDSDTLLIDCRSNISFKEQHYPNSINITIEMVKYAPGDVMKILKSKDFKKVVLYCNGSSCDTSESIARHLVYTGYVINVYRPGWNVIRNFCLQ